MNIQRKALYNSLRMNWLRDSSVAVEPWQIEDYRSLNIDGVFLRLKELGYDLDQKHFLVYVEEFETPEDLSDSFCEEIDDAQLADKVYLLLFEAWRRLVHDKPCLSVFCDEVDFQIFHYDQGDTADLEDLEDVIASLQAVLDENVDQGIDPHDAFDLLLAESANDIEAFIVDYICDQFDNDNERYASDLIDGFYDYVTDLRWFDFLKLRILNTVDPVEADSQFDLFVEDLAEDTDLELLLEALTFSTQLGDSKAFMKLLDIAVRNLDDKEDFLELLSLCSEYCYSQDDEDTGALLENIHQARSEISSERPFTQSDPDLAELTILMKQALARFA
jgi:hypothetical protein